MLRIPANAFASAIPSHMLHYGPNVNLDQARKVLAGAIADARRRTLPMAIAVVDTAGLLVAFERMDDTQTASVLVSQDKAVTAAMFRRPSKAFQDVVAAGGDGLRVLALRHATPIEGGLPILVDGNVIGAVGVSGGTPDEDGLVARAGLDALSG